ncbi:MAG: MFS transporter [Prochlorotrichaceae cyanobacterium]
MSRFLTELNPSSPDPEWEAPRSLPSPSFQSVPTARLALDAPPIPLKDDPPPEEPPIDEPSTETGFGTVFRNFNFMRLWSGQVFSQIADKVYLVLMIMMISHRFEAPGQSISGWVSSIMVAFTIPAILLGSIAGVYADRHRKKTILVLSNLIRSALVLSLPLLLPLCQGLQWQQIPLGFYVLLLVTFSVSTLTQFFAPAEQAIIPLIVEKSALLSANSLYTTTMMGAMIVGFAVGEPLLDWANHWVETIAGWSSGEVLFVGCCYALAGLTLVGVITSETIPSRSDDRPHPSVWQEIREGWQYLQENRIVRSALLQLVVLFSVFAALAVLAVRLAEVIPQLESDQFGWLLAIGSLGMGLGAFAIGHSGDRFDRLTLVRTGSIGMALSLLGLGVVISQHSFNPLSGVLVCITSLGLFAAFIGIPLQTTIQAETPAEMRGKVFGLQNNGVNIALSLPLVLASVAEQTLGLGLTFGLLGIGVILGNLLQSPSAPD